MADIDMLRRIAGIAAISGFEENAADSLKSIVTEMGADEVYTDSLGGLHGVFEPKGEVKSTILIDAHMDEIGLMVSEICENGMLKFIQIGGIDQRVLPAKRVWVHGKETVFGVVTSLPPHITKSSDYKKSIPMEEMFIDIGMTKENAEKIISVGDPVTFSNAEGMLLNDRYVSKALDDRAGCAAITQAAKKLCGKLENTRLHMMFSSQEEVSSAAMASAYISDADMCICVDVGHASTPDSKADDTFELSGGVMIGVAPSLKKSESDAMRKLADELEMEYQVEVMGGNSGTNAWSIQIAKEGIPCALLSIPLRYMHTGAEVIALSDIDSVADLLAAYIEKKDKEAR